MIYQQLGVPETYFFYQQEQQEQTEEYVYKTLFYNSFRALQVTQDLQKTLFSLFQINFEWKMTKRERYWVVHDVTADISLFDPLVILDVIYRTLFPQKKKKEITTKQV